eukprot:TRINITY_DN7507_c0_g1_i1.p1 TRINITY_DN7507_c0_g1~~TRINITY_DN7507_c0_g1_i1.p1  ORF type:complete len:266 (-),score=59.41 TRINITY_DN7507_c0_g1_i1:28-825(-)
MGQTGSKKDNAEFHLPSGLYQNWNWDPKVVKRLILHRRLAPFQKGEEECENEDYEECPICFLYYPGGLNRSTCCKKAICTECFLQIKKPNGQASCPFCQRGSYTVQFTGPLSKEEKAKDDWEQQQVTEAKIRMRNEEIEQDRIREERRRSQMSFDSDLASSPPQGSEILISQSLPSSRNIQEKENPVMVSTSFPPNKIVGNKEKPVTKTAKEIDLEDLIMQEAIRLSKQETDGFSEDGDESVDSSAPSQDDMDLALALALSLQCK